MNRLAIRAGNALARFLERLAAILEDAARHLNRCEDCGRSTFYGEPCK